MVTVTVDAIKKLIDSRKSRALLLAQTALPEHQYLAFRRLFLDEFGKSGLESDLERLFNENSEHTRKARHGQE
ncbi:hypothetical protein [Methylomonas sp. 11b]|uniref:hypothetical protein n=1 Tax=Methylomonas sp. 11b TaxID=1168169 RepID=UPI00047D72F7|nr:hypothetical protein [Methylomonas sp. 11b]